MKKKQLKQISAAITLLFAFAPLAHAEISIKGSGGVDTDAMHLEVKTTATDESRTESESKMEMHKEDDGQIKIEIESKSEMHMMEDGEKMEGVEHAKGEANEHALEAFEKMELHMDLEDGVRDEHGADEPEMDMAVKVRTEHDFEDFVHHKAKSDEHLKNVEIKDGKIKVEYEEDAKLFGFIGTTINARATVDEKDNVEVSYPWYHIFMKKHVSKASLQSNIARAIAAERKAVKEGMATTTIEATIETSLGIPNLFEIIANTLKEVSVRGEAEVKAQ